MQKQILSRRLRSARAAMKHQDLSAIVVTKPANVTYLTGFSGDSSWMILTAKGSCLLTDSRFGEQAHKECPFCRIVERKTTIAPEAGRIISRLKSISSVGVEDTTQVRFFDALKKHLNVGVKKTAGLVERFRVVKDAEEVSAIRAAAKLAQKALDATLPSIRAGMTESQVAGVFDYEVRQLGSRTAFDTIVAFGANASRPHHRPTNRKLKKNDTILLDFCATRNGYCSDMTRCFAFGKPSSYYANVYHAVWKAQQAAIKILKAGVKNAIVDEAAKAVLRGNDVPLYGHGTGHGIGLEVHESPIVASKSAGSLAEGAAITVEPGVYIPGKLGIRIEDDVLITKTGYKYLSPRAEAHVPVLKSR